MFGIRQGFGVATPTNFSKNFYLLRSSTTHFPSLLPILRFVLDKKFQRNVSKYAIFYRYENPKLPFPFFSMANFEAFRWNFSSSTNSEIGRSALWMNEIDWPFHCGVKFKKCAIQGSSIALLTLQRLKSMFFEILFFLKLFLNGARSTDTNCWLEEKITIIALFFNILPNCALGGQNHVGILVVFLRNNEHIFHYWYWNVLIYLGKL